MISLNDIWGENYYLPTGEVNPDCKLFAGWKQDRIDNYLQKNNIGI